MRRTWISGTCLALAASLDLLAGASPIQVTVTGYDGTGPVDVTRQIPDDFDGGAIHLKSAAISRQGVKIPGTWGIGLYPAYRHDVNSRFLLGLSFSEPPVTKPGFEPTISMTGGTRGAVT